MDITCKRCLLDQTDQELYLTIHHHITTLDESVRCDGQEYIYRIEECRSCHYLVNGMCSLCGCFVEMRAAVKKNRCADTPEKW